MDATTTGDPRRPLGGVTANDCDGGANLIDEPTPEELEQLARSVAMSGALGDRDRLDVVAALRRLAELEKAVKSRRFEPAPT